MKPTRRTLLIITALTLLIGMLSFVTPALAIEDDDDGHIPADQVVNDDLMISGFDIVIDGTVNGNVFASGNDVIVNGTINGNLLVNSARTIINGAVNGSVAGTGWEFTVNGPIEGTVYFTGAALIIGPEAHLNRNLIVSNYSIEIQSGAVIEKDLQGNSYQTIINGQIMQDVSLDSAAIEIGGQIGGDLQARQVAPPGPPDSVTQDFAWMDVIAQINSVTLPATIKPGVRVSPQAQIDGQFVYSSEVNQNEAIQTMPSGGLIFERIDPKPSLYRMHGQLTPWILTRLRELLTLLALGAIIIWQLPAPLKQSVSQARTQPIPATAWGGVVLFGGYLLVLMLGLLVVLLGILIAAVTLGGLAMTVFGIGFSGLTLLAGIFSLLVIYGSKLVASYLLGDLLLPRIFPNRTIPPFFSLSAGILIYAILRAIPVLGLIFAILATLLGLGAMWLAYKAWRHPVDPDGVKAVLADQDPVEVSYPAA